MFHGGTNFGFMAGSNGGAKGFTVDTTSYDYDAPLDESGRPTVKYSQFRDLIAKYTPEPLPQPDEVPAPVAVPPARLALKKSFFFAQPRIVRADEPRSFEDLGLDYGLIDYETTAPAAGRQTLKVGRLMDYAIVVVDGKRVGTLDRRLGQKSIDLDVPAAGVKIDLLVEGLSRVNFGPALPDERKGLEGPITLGDGTLRGWRHAIYPFDPVIKADAPGSHLPGDPAYYAGTLQVSKVGDTFLDLRHWNKGFVWVNGHNLGRFWNVGPQGTLYLPGPPLLVVDLGKSVDLSGVRELPRQEGVNGRIKGYRIYLSDTPFKGM